MLTNTLETIKVNCQQELGDKLTSSGSVSYRLTLFGC
jgi:hypothetical protein